MLKEPKNPTFNEFIPSLIFSDDFSLLEAVVSDLDLLNSIYQVFGESCKYGFDIQFRIKHGCRELDSTLLCSGVVDSFDEPLIFPQSQQEILFPLFSVHLYKWKKLIDNVYSQAYNPIENYDRQEDTSLSYEGSENVTRNVDSDRKVKGTTADTRNDTSSANSSSQKNVFAFDSAEASPSDSDSGTTTSTGTGSSNSTVDNSDTEKRIETEGHSFANRKNVTASRIHGNIGITTNQQMMTAELEFRLKNDFFNAVYEDIANTLLKPIY